MNEFITLLQRIRHFPISDSEKKVLYNIINNRQRDSNNEIKKLKNFFGFISNQKVENLSTTSVETNSLMEKGIIEPNNTPIDSNPKVVSNRQVTNEKCKLTSLGLIHIFSNKYTYSPDFLIKYKDDIVLHELLFKHFQSNTIKAATAKFFNIITDYLTTSSNYIINLSLEQDKPLTPDMKEEFEHKIKIFSLILGFKITILFNDYNIISSNIGANNDKVIFAIHQVETLMKKNLSKDPKFLNLLSMVSSEFNSGYNDFTSFTGQDNKH